MREWKNSSGLSARQQKYVVEYLSNGFNSEKACIAAGYSPRGARVMGAKLQAMPHIQRKIRAVQAREVTQAKITFDHKLEKLGKVINAFIPDDGEPDSRKVSVALSAIAEANKMQGHYAPDKHQNINLNLNADADIAKLKELTEEVVKAHEKEY